ncbi:alpha/beta fold hydrolase [Tsukamurella soli]|uniref:Alpha/beta hydrolase n=1 Tax=Tsukamurella soli TaxID=644556 RepID=A0ABP8J482_9ACTN
MRRRLGLALSDDGTELFYVDHPSGAGACGPGGKPTLLLVHGWAEASRSWGPGFVAALTASGHRVVALDLRGHGYSSVPDPVDAGAFGSDRWAADLAAVRSAAAIEGPVILVGWSYGGLVIADHLAERGTDGVAGVVLIGAITSIGGGADGPFPGGVVGESMVAALPDALSAKPGKAATGLGRLRMMPADPAFGTVIQQQFGMALATPPHVRGGLFRRTVDHDGDLATWHFPVLIQHGTDDAVVSPSVAEHHAAVLPDATVSWWDGGGHAPFAEDPRRCAGELAVFADGVGLAAIQVPADHD